jgi:hypothetical protein
MNAEIGAEAVQFLEKRKIIYNQNCRCSVLCKMQGDKAERHAGQHKSTGNKADKYTGNSRANKYADNNTGRPVKITVKYKHTNIRGEIQMIPESVNKK